MWRLGVGVEELDAAEWVEGVFSIAILLGKKGVNKLKKLLKLGRRSRALGGLGKVGSRVPFIPEGSYLGDSIVDTFKDRILKILVRTYYRNMQI
jgi:hypothetical protein